jgi:dihydroxy-acid dehydratase
MNNPIHKTGGLTHPARLAGPDGAVVKSAGFDADVFEGTARVFDGEQGAMDAVTEGTLQARRRRRHPLRGPQGRPGHARDARRHRRDQGRRPGQGRPAAHRRPVLRRDDGLCIGHVAPEATDGGPIAFVRDGDRIRLDLAARTLDLLVDDDELARRREGWAPLPPRYTTGVLGKYAKLVGSAAQGAICG